MVDNDDVNAVPNRWLGCPRKCETVIAERFLAFKTPLSNAFKDQVPLECTFTPEMVFSYCKALKLKLGLWIDLTYTKRFYDREIVESRNIQYVKLQCRGHGETPSHTQTQSFIEIVDSFITDRPFDIIAVHCTHGFNRTGFLIVSYLVERLDCSVEAAITMFSKARPPGIYKQDYINELYRRYDNEDDASLAPDLPDWYFEKNIVEEPPSKRKHADEAEATTSMQARRNQNNQLYGNDNNTGADSDDIDKDDEIDVKGSNSGETLTNGDYMRKPKKRRREQSVKDAKFMSGVPGVVLVTDQPRLANLQIKVQNMCNWRKTEFAGSQPVSMDHNNLILLQEMPYMVSWKADGTRYMMLINKRDEIYFVDRNNCCFQVENMSFVNAKDLSVHLENTLVDGEMVLDKVGNEIIPRYLIYDVVRICNRNIGKESFKNRLNCIKKEIINPRHEAMKRGIINRSTEPFGVRIKYFWDIKQAAFLLSDKFAKNLCHEPDGLIFQPVNDPYKPGNCPEVLKWKPLSMNSVDFRLKIVTEDAIGCVKTKIGLLYVVGLDVYFGKMKYTKELKDFDNKIIECVWNSNTEQWQFMRERTDKSMPNSYKTAMAVCESIKKPVTTEQLLCFIGTKGFKDDERSMPPPSRNIVPRIPQQQQPQQQQQQQSQQQQQQCQQYQSQPQPQQQQQQQQQQHQQQQQQREERKPPPQPPY